MTDTGRTYLIPLVLIGTLVFFFLYFFIFRTGGPGPGEESTARVGERAPDFELSVLGGNTVKLSDYRGRVVFLNIWASWCPPCREEMPAMEALHNRLKDRPFKMLTVSIDQKGKEVVGDFTARMGLTLPVLLDPKGITYKLYGLTGVPETFILDKNGVVIQKIIGPENWMNAQWLEYFDRIIGKD
jgi:peroxiredoxin